MAGVTAAITESVVTYPLDFVKTQSQLSRRVNGVKYQLPESITKIYRGCSALVLGNSIRGVVRYNVYNAATKFMTDSQGSLAAPQAVVAGMMTGFMESLVVVPFENIKTTMVERTLDPINATANMKLAVAESKIHQEQLPSINSNSSNSKSATPSKTSSIPKANAESYPKVAPRPPADKVHSTHLLEINPDTKSLHANILDMYKTRGFRAFVQGFMPTMFRQIANSVVQFTTYTFFKQALYGSSSEDAPIPAHLALLSAMLSGASVVIATQPIDVVKTRMMSINARTVYRNTLKTTYKILAEEGPLTFWSGSIPRFFTICLGSTMTFGLYEIFSDMLNLAVNETPFSA